MSSATCRQYLERELALLKNLKCVVALGKLAFDAYLGILRDSGIIRSRAAYTFGHNVQYEIPGAAVLVGSYHPSQQNTSTGKLTAEMLREVFERARVYLLRLTRCWPRGSRSTLPAIICARSGVRSTPSICSFAGTCSSSAMARAVL